jgi:hypothetical protein
LRSPFLPNSVGRGGVAEPYQQLGRGTRLASYEPSWVRGFVGFGALPPIGLKPQPRPGPIRRRGVFFWSARLDTRIQNRSLRSRLGTRPHSEPRLKEAVLGLPTK